MLIKGRLGGDEKPNDFLLIHFLIKDQHTCKDTHYVSQGDLLPLSMTTSYEVIPCKTNGHPVFISGRTNQASVKNNTFILILKHFQK